MSNVNMSVPKCNFEEKFSTSVFESFCFWNIRELKSDCWTSRHLLLEKNLNYSWCMEFRILVEKWYIYEAYIFTNSLVQTSWLETTPLCLNARFCLNNFPISQYFYWNLSNRLTFICSPPNYKYNLSYSKT